jgi:hypothetical protein
MTKLEEIRQRKNYFLTFSEHSTSLVRMKKKSSVQTKYGGVDMKTNKKKNNAQPAKLEEKKTGYGDKKLEGPNRPST